MTRARVPRLPSRWPRSLRPRSLRPRSLRAKITLSSILMLALGIVVATAISLTGVKHYLVSSVDERLAGSRAGIERSGVTLREVSTLAHVTGADQALSTGAAHAGASAYGDDRTLYLPVDARGRAQKLFGREPTPTQRSLAAALPDVPALASGSGEPVDVKTGEGRPYRATAVRLSDGQLVVLASGVGAVGEIMHKVIRLEIAAGVALTAALGTSIFVSSRRRLRPMEDMVEAASSIAEGCEDDTSGLDLSRRVGAREGPHHQVTEVERLRVALNAMLHQVEAAFVSREHAAAHLRRFVADASHELRTPLSAVRGYLQLHERGMLRGEEEKARALARMTAETDRMARLVDELLALARLDQRPELRPVPVDLVALSEETLADLSAQQPERPVTLTAPTRPCVTLADEATLRQAVGNLVANVRVHTPPSAPVEVTVSAAGESLTLAVRDQGPGMSARDAERIFDRFFRSSDAAPRGSGLGMSVVRAAVEAHHGTVHITTAPHRGLTATLTLPRQARDSGANGAG